ncbi:MAG: ethanolamine ammonia-lyase subunit EutC [Edaphobacter sp.]|uniref:ethanolamine ammonia-lyase subunit EutC n=1 Tax=Edaphobacter sp. TaxID=1934404 RepID=UPI00238F24B0|nr:ethanolamine ammonia-lyase subunit EutC [Edaphobacter sp.]MDE1175751.1 ethanolamine ammonia-lyase subunit EutC [Edaphobacter sp.]
MSDSPVRREPWHTLTQWTSARIALGRAGGSMPTASVLEFNSDHALARDAIHMPLDTSALRERLAEAGFDTLRAWSRAQDRSEYLRRPDLGRMLDPECASSLRADNTQREGVLTVVVADGLSALAPASHALPLLEMLRNGLQRWTLDPVVMATQARVALGDAIGELRGAEAVLMLIGERPGLKSPDSLGAYLTYRPRIGRMDSERNCVSNIRPVGLSYEQAAFRLLHLLGQARIVGATGISLKDNSDNALGLQGA